MTTITAKIVYPFVICWLIAFIAAAHGLKIASFNIQVFGTRKAADSSIMQIIASIVKRYDVILIQEVRDSSDTAVDSLISKVNSGTSSRNGYQKVISQRLGRTVSKEQYLFLYKRESLTLVDTYQFEDPNDVFQREPFSVRFRPLKSGLTDIVLMAIHTDPDVAVSEMEALATVHNAVKQHWRTENILIMGDLNADCSYASKKALKGLTIRNNPPFVWLIGDEIDTTTGNSNCAYDRFIASGDSLIRYIVPNSAKVYRFDQAYSLSHQMTLNVSDHYPIELELRSSATVPAEQVLDDSRASVASVNGFPEQISSFVCVLVMSFCLMSYACNAFEI